MYHCLLIINVRAVVYESYQTCCIVAVNTLTTLYFPAFAGFVGKIAALRVNYKEYSMHQVEEWRGGGLPYVSLNVGEQPGGKKINLLSVHLRPTNSSRLRFQNKKCNFPNILKMWILAFLTIIQQHVRKFNTSFVRK